jgi:DNA (cytosine-5)-methyltransferase 1
MTRRILDLFSCAGGAGYGYHLAGFEVVGVDIEPQPHYPFAFVCMDALEAMRVLLSSGCILDNQGSEWRLEDFDAVHASPPCQRFTTIAFIWREREGYDYDGKHPDLVDATRQLLQATGKPYVIENVPGAPLNNPVMLCGLMFGLKTVRHRLFETNPFMLAPGHLAHPESMTTNSFRDYSSFENGATHITVAGHNFKRVDGIAAFGDTCQWMTREELAEAIPPAYTCYIGGQLLNHIEAMEGVNL